MIHRYVATVGERSIEVTVEAASDGAAQELPGVFRVSVDGRSRLVDARLIEGTAWSLATPGGGPGRIVDVDGSGPDYVAAIDGVAIPIKLIEGRRAALAGVATRPHKSGPQPLRAPMPGKVVKLLAQAGEAVKAGQGVLVIEAMKMENELRAVRDGRVVEVMVTEGQTVDSGQVLATIE